MKKLITLVALCLASLSQVAMAADATCEARATEKKLAGAAKNSFMKKCEKDSKASGAGAACEMQAKDKKLAGAAKNSFVKKCVKDSAAAPAPAAAASK
jgi:hypothetical protein